MLEYSNEEKNEIPCQTRYTAFDIMERMNLPTNFSATKEQLERILEKNTEATRIVGNTVVWNVKTFGSHGLVPAIQVDKEQNSFRPSVIMEVLDDNLVENLDDYEGVILEGCSFRQMKHVGGAFQIDQGAEETASLVRLSLTEPDPAHKKSMFQCPVVSGLSGAVLGHLWLKGDHIYPRVVLSLGCAVVM
eukprot:Trichotokara_eunicae@DN4772_c0_g1_i1.p1